MVNNIWLGLCVCDLWGQGTINGFWMSDIPWCPLIWLLMTSIHFLWICVHFKWEIGFNNALLGNHLCIKNQSAALFMEVAWIILYWVNGATLPLLRSSRFSSLPFLSLNHFLLTWPGEGQQSIDRRMHQKGEKKLTGIWQ